MKKPAAKVGKDGKPIKKVVAKKPVAKAGAKPVKKVVKPTSAAASKLQKGTARAKAAALMKAKRAKLKVSFYLDSIK